MSGILAGVDQRTQLAGHNRLELLLFRLQGPQRFGINVFKVKEVISCPPLTQVPEAHPVMCGMAHLRGQTVPILDISKGIGGPALPRDGSGYVIVSEYNRSVQGFLVREVDRIINMGWDQIKPPPRGTGKDSYLTAVTEFEGELIEVIDVEKIMKEIIGGDEEVSEGVIDSEILDSEHHILVVDDSMVARNQIKRVLDQLGVEATLARDGQDAYEKLSAWIEEGKDLNNFLSMVISDVEMPKMDGYTLTTKMREHPQMKDLYVLLHTSLSGVFNEAMVKKVGADRFLAKFAPDELATAVQERLREYDARKAA
ncbi:two-component system, chemotaxis family, chemotaxis protein CheV [Methylomarinovum caldicuralii]|uniref:Two-component system, chemotaxis family, chemotaxis protein CheV n=1 Tax=Methylomarinovum caldicuralii TaxID=438856 RepID=A0AAU9C592_9GAMM|nr:chemotaxis protein CheV [Methylomarinovum caldicuralii]BCX82918.1 two-component system, chemotaxis family, chemotaxis protein CheV [Methylomarinovum caldicuralii]